MKNTQLKISIGNGIVAVEYKTGMVSVDDLVTVGNEFRVKNGLQPIYKANILKSAELASFVKVIKADVDNGCYPYFDLDDNDLIKVKGRTKAAVTTAFLPIALKIASMIDPSFEAYVFRVFIEGKMLQVRDGGGEVYKRLNLLINEAMKKLEGREAHKGHYIVIAKTLNKKVFEDIESEDWNNALVTVQHHEKRLSIENDMLAVLKLGLVKDWEHLKQIAAEI